MADLNTILGCWRRRKGVYKNLFQAAENNLKKTNIKKRMKKLKYFYKYERDMTLNIYAQKISVKVMDISMYASIDNFSNSIFLSTSHEFFYIITHTNMINKHIYLHEFELHTLMYTYL